MRKALIPMIACLALCGAATTAMVISSARAQPGPHKPMMVAGAPGLQLAANDTPPPDGAPPPRGLRQRTPADMAARMTQICQDQLARQSGELAYTETKLNLTASEQPLFERWKDARLSVARRHAEQCATRTSQRLAQRQTNQGQNSQNKSAQPRPAANRPGPAERMAQEEDRLKERLADIDAERPALQAFYDALSPQQKMELDRGGMGRHGPRGRMMDHSRFAQAMGPRGPMGPGVMGRGPMDRGPMGRPPMPLDGPGAPPPQER
jgi:hypothetical protein